MGLPGIPGGSARAWRRCDAHASLRRPARNIRQAVAVVARGMARRHGNLGHPVHPARMKNDCVRQVSWLTGHRRFGRLLRTISSQWHSGRSARRLQLQGQPGFCTPFPFDPVSGNLSRHRTYRSARHAASAKFCKCVAGDARE